MTKADWIRSMSDEDLAEFLDIMIESPCLFCKWYGDGNSCDGSCDGALREWLKQEHEDNEND